MVTIEDVRSLALGLPRPTEIHSLVFDAWRMVVPKRVAAEYERGLEAS